jgi:DHA2 family multidrug resistance protein-like MFS transporter
VFLVAVPVMVLLLAVGPVLLPEFRDPEAGRLDILGAAQSLVAMLAVIYGLKQIAQDGLGWLPGLSVVAGVAVGVVFLRRQRVSPYPLIDLRLFRAPAFSTSIAAMSAAVFVVGGIFLFVAQYLQLVLGKGPFEAGLWLLPSTGGLIVGSMLAPLLVRRAPGSFVLASSLACTAVGVGILAQVDAASGLAVVVAGTAIMGLGAGSVGTLATDLVVGAAPPERAGAASAISETGAELGGALGIALLGSIGTAVYRSQIADLVPAGVAPEAAEAARDTLAGATDVARQLPDGLGAALLAGARDAFVEGLQVAALTGTVVVGGLALIAAVLLRHARGGEGSPELGAP